MKAIQYSRFGDRDVLNYLEIPEPIALEDQVLIEVTASGVNFVDIRERQGIYQRPETHVGSDKSLPRISGLQVTGRVRAVDYSVPGWVDEVLRITEGRGVDVILESIGGEIFTKNFECLATFGRHIIFGSTRGPGQPVPPRQLMAKSQAMIGIYLPVYFARPDLIRQGMEEMVEKFVSGSVKAKVACVLPLSQVGEAHRLLEEQKVSGAIVLDPRN